jgi:hypothetical protein
LQGIAPHQRIENNLRLPEKGWKDPVHLSLRIVIGRRTFLAVPFSNDVVALEKAEAKGLEGEESNRIKYNERYQEREESNPQRQVWSLPFFL